MCERLVRARIGQGGFRKEVLAAWGGRCAITGCATTQVLRASHIMPWRYADNDEGLDPNNGLPWIANLDCLFDASLIGFDGRGGMVVSFELVVCVKRIASYSVWPWHV
jgi:putative restriction endonuclease